MACVLGSALPQVASASVLLTHAFVISVDPAIAGKADTLVDLPYLWDQAHPGSSGEVELVTYFTLSEIPAGQYGLVASKMANAYAVSLNGVLLDQFSETEAFGVGDSKLPRLLPFSHALLQTHNEIRIRLRGDAGRQGGLSSLFVGPFAEAKTAYDAMWVSRVGGRLLVIMFSAVVGLVGLALWATQLRRNATGKAVRERLYLYGGLAEMCWVFRVGDSLLETPPLPTMWWSVLSSLALGGWACLTALFALELLGAGSSQLAGRWRKHLLWLWMAGIPASIAGWVYIVPRALTAWYVALGVAFAIFGWVYARLVIRPGVGWAPRALMLAIAVNVVVGCVDTYLLRIAPSTAGSSSLYYTSMLFGVAAGIVVLMRFRQLTREADEFSATLTSRVAQREEELRQSYAQLEVLVREQTRVAERTRILRDMHDGVGSHISAAIRQLQSGLASRESVVHTLQESMDQLKLSIDSIHLPAGDINAVLANVRYRMEPRLVSVGIQVIWQVEVLTPLAHWDEKQTRQLQFMVYECISNVLQHAHASLIHIRAQEGGEQSALEITDNGRGFDVNATGNRGLHALKQRAQALGAHLRLDSRPGKTSVEIVIPWR